VPTSQTLGVPQTLFLSLGVLVFPRGTCEDALIIGPLVEDWLRKQEPEPEASLDGERGGFEASRSPRFNFT
jgi:hypothetical protein